MPPDEQPNAEAIAEAEKNKMIPVSGKNAETVAALAALPKPAIQMREVEFNFKTPRSDKKAPDTLPDGSKNPDAGKPVDELGKVLTKRPSIKLAIPMPTFDGLLEALSDPKMQQYILEILEETVVNAARVQVGDDLTPVNDQDHLDISKLTLSFLAAQPRSERRGGGIAKEVWDAFGKDYVEVMPAVSGKTAEQIGNAVKILMQKFQPAKSQKPVIAYLREQLAVWYENTRQQEEFAECYEFLDEKAKTLLAADETALLASL